MARGRHSDEEALNLLREIEMHLAGGMDVPSVFRQEGIGSATRDIWRRAFGRMRRAPLSDLRALVKENRRLKGMVAARVGQRDSEG